MSDTSHDSETPAHGQQVITAVAFIYASFDGVTKVFLPKRAGTKKFLPNVFELPGGHIEYAEDIEVGLKREIMEEFAMRIKVEEVFGAFTYTNQIKSSHSIEVLYFATFIDPIDQITINQDDHSEFLWVADSDLDKIYSETKGYDDIEFKYVRKGFAQLKRKI